jgi:hypothetical protein
MLPERTKGHKMTLLGHILARFFVKLIPKVLIYECRVRAEMAMSIGMKRNIFTLFGNILSFLDCANRRKKVICRCRLEFRRLDESPEDSARSDDNSPIAESFGDS